MTPPRGRSLADRARRLLPFAILLELSVMAVLLTRDDVLVYRLRAALHLLGPTAVAQDLAALKNDPAVGSALPFGKAGVALRRAARPSQVGYLVVPVGDCASCIRADLPKWQLECARHRVSMVLVTSAAPSSARSFVKRLRLDAPFVSDPSESLERRLNVLWYGRPYLYTSAWRLAWTPQRIDTSTPFSERALAALRGKADTWHDVERSR